MLQNAAQEKPPSMHVVKQGLRKSHPPPNWLRGLCMVPNDQKYVTKIISEFKTKNYVIAKMWTISNMN